MITRESVAPGDVLTYWVWTGSDGGCMTNVDAAGLLYAKVIRANRMTITVETEHGLVQRMRYALFSKKCTATEWSPWTPKGN